MWRARWERKETKDKVQKGNKGERCETASSVTRCPAHLASFKFNSARLYPSQSTLVLNSAWRESGLIKNWQVRYWAEIKRQEQRRKWETVTEDVLKFCTIAIVIVAIIISVFCINIVIHITTIGTAIAIPIIILMTVITQHSGVRRLGRHCFNGS